MGSDAFSGKVAIVTGGASGIGRALGEELVRRGSQVWLADIDAEAAVKTAAELEGPGSARGLGTDVRDAAAVEELVSGVREARGRLDFMFNNAGIAVFGDVRDMSLDDWNALVDVNLRGVIHGIAAAYPRMIQQGYGHIVNTASVAGLIPVPSMTGYATTKHAVVGLSSSLRYEAERYGVRVSAVCPGVIGTPILEHMKLLNLDRDELLADAGRLYPVERCARAVLRGVERNRGLIVVTPFAHFFWRIQRFVPRFTGLLLRRSMARNPALK
jgi:NAD(P)-dependent dehydrogenase (short-subunit alcohol dehydrogenase family)